MKRTGFNPVCHPATRKARVSGGPGFPEWDAEVQILPCAPECQRVRIGIAACLRNRCLRVRISPLAPDFLGSTSRHLHSQSLSSPSLRAVAEISTTSSAPLPATGGRPQPVATTSAAAPATRVVIFARVRHLLMFLQKFALTQSP